MDLTLDPAALGSAAVQIAVITVVTNYAKTALAAYLTDGEVSALAPVLALVVGALVGVAAALALHTDAGAGAAAGFLYGLVATGAYRALPDAVKGKRTAPPERAAPPDEVKPPA